MRPSLLAVLAVLLWPQSLPADDSWLPDWAQDLPRPRPIGIGIDHYRMDHPYEVNELHVSLPGLALPPGVERQVGVNNEFVHSDIKLDAWLLPFLNVFIVAGRIDGQTDIDFSHLAGFVPLPPLQVDYDGRVYGGGATLALGGRNLFASLTASTTRTDLDGDFDTQIRTWTLQPRLGARRGPWRVWVGGLYIDTEERHRGRITLPGLGPVDFDVELAEEAQFTPSIGIGLRAAEHANAYLELGTAGDRDFLLANVTYRF